MDRRSFLKFMLATPLAAQFDVEKMLWVPKPMIVVPELPKRAMLYGVNKFGAKHLLGYVHNMIPGVDQSNEIFEMLRHFDRRLYPNYDKGHFKSAYIEYQDESLIRNDRFRKKSNP